MTWDESHSDLRPFGPKRADHPSCGKACTACKQPMAEGQYTTLVALGPGDNGEAQARARAGRPYNAVAVEVHWTCATGEPDDVASQWVTERFPNEG